MLLFCSIFIAATMFVTISSAIPTVPATPNIPVVHGGASDLGIGGHDGLHGLLGLREAAILSNPLILNFNDTTYLETPEQAISYQMANLNLPSSSNIMQLMLDPTGEVGL